VKKANKFESTWNGIDEVIHEMKGAMADITVANNLLKRGTQKIIKGLEVIDKQIEKMVNNNE